MKEIKTSTYKGTRILLGNEKRNYLNKCIQQLVSQEFEEIQIPIIQYQELFKDKVGEENNNLMFNFTDRGGRSVCLAPEYTAVIQNLANTIWKFERNKKLFYVAECFRGERSQRGRWRQFTQLGVEIINPKEDYLSELIEMSEDLIRMFNPRLEIITNTNVTRGLDYYKDGVGWEIRSKDGLQLCGGGVYEPNNSCGFSIGVDRVIIYE